MVFQRRSALNSVVLGKILVLLMMLPLSSVQAFEYDWSGFATIGMGKQDGSNILFQEFDENLSMSTDTKIGGQLDIKFKPLFKPTLLRQIKIISQPCLQRIFAISRMQQI